MALSIILLAFMSPSVWRVWIEMLILCLLALGSPCHPPCGGCGLKSILFKYLDIFPESPSVWRVWIEISIFYTVSQQRKSPSVWRVWIEIDRFGLLYFPIESPSVWRVWIEIFGGECVSFCPRVTLRVEGVD